MTVEQLPVRVREFASYLDGLLARLDQSAGWCGVFWQRDPEGMQACLDGREVPPWDVVESLLQDLAAECGPAFAAEEKQRASSLHAAALRAYDRRPGGRDALRDRLDVMLREQKYAAERLTALHHALAATPAGETADALRVDLAWARDDHTRATARRTELGERMAELDRLDADALPSAVQGAGFRVFPQVADVEPAAVDSGPEARGTFRGTPGLEGRRDAFRGAEADPGPEGRDALPQAPNPLAHEGPEEPAPTAQPAPAPTPAPKPRKRRRGGARFAGMDEEEAAAPVALPGAGMPEVPAPPGRGGRTPRGARFAGAAEEAPRAHVAVDEGARAEVAAVVDALERLRGEGRSGEAHAVLAEAAYWPAARFPLLAAELERAGLAADWATLLWEAASLPADRLVAAADALVAAGRDADGRQILRQGVVRPAGEIGQAVAALEAEGRRADVRALLDAYVRVRTPEEAARSAQADPRTLVPLLLETAQAVSAERYWDLLHALRVAGLSA
ncbi:hypothetical protein ACIQ6Y_03970 [Streptomyces sp. NPDC096205]|uniref:hypothetical protein n=1 Tax=Streptomyces sp. NPDC096205 TaxID=3366081 RepID=UPI003810388A